MNAKEQFTEDVMSSLDGAGRARLNPGVREKILKGSRERGAGSRERGAGSGEQGAGSVKFGLVWKIAAVILLLISLNVFTMVHFSKSTVSSSNSTKSVAVEYFSYINHYNL
ncbi:MAG: hypothetical protein NTU51_01230 [Bacteroidetes bacterium]|nr:hypothetical protein [Bacteroidota bacterium]